MEVLYAYNNQVPVYVINPDKSLIHDVWLRVHTNKFFTSTIECFNYIKGAK